MTDQEREAWPTAKAEDVEFAPEQADEDDREAKERMEAADRRATNGQGE